MHQIVSIKPKLKATAGRSSIHSIPLSLITVKKKNHVTKKETNLTHDETSKVDPLSK